MSVRRVVITGMGAVSPLGVGRESLLEGLIAGRSGVTALEDFRGLEGLRCMIGGRVPDVDPRIIPRPKRRAMSAMSIFAVLAAREALDQANVPDATLSSGDLGVCIGSTTGSSATYSDFFEDFLTDRSLARTKSTMFFKIMNHSCAANVSQALGITGRLLSPSAACATGVQAVGYGFEMIRAGRAEMMLCGGADELHPLSAATFDIIGAASTGYNADPGRSPRPFDADRDGTVCSEGSGVLLLESEESALERGADILAEVAGFATITDPDNITSPDPRVLARCMGLALEDAGLSPADVDLVNAHATATELGDIAEAEALAGLVGPDVPVASFKGHLGHTLAASGALEIIGSVAAMRRNLLVPTLNLERVDPRCEGVHFVRKLATSGTSIAILLKNNFAFGGVNASIVVREMKT